MKKQVVTSPQLPPTTGPLSQGVVVGPLLFTSGMGGTDPGTGELAGPSVGAQTIQALGNIRSVLVEAGLDFEDVVKVTAHLHDVDHDFEEFNEAYRECFSAPYPVRTTVGSRMGGAIRVEIDVVAVRRSESEVGGAGA